MNSDDIGKEQEDDDEPDDFIMWLGQAYANRNTDGTYVLNPIKYKQMNAAVKLINEICDKNGRVQVTPLDSKELHGYFGFTVPLIHLYGDELKKFRQLIEMVDVIGIYPNSDSDILAEFVINDIFVKVEE